jgi:hypothetical protein
MKNSATVPVSVQRLPNLFAPNISSAAFDRYLARIASLPKKKKKKKNKKKGLLLHIQSQ